MSPDHNNSVSYKEAADMIGCTHNYVRMLVSKGRIAISHTETTTTNVEKTFVSKTDVELYIEMHRERHTVKFVLTDNEEQAVRNLLRDMRNRIGRFSSNY